jgi:hypothetical protein
MVEAKSLTICGLTYRVVFARADEVHHLEDSDGFASFSTNTIYVRAGMPESRMRDALIHEVMHAFLESSGVGSFMKDSFRGDDAAFERFEETFIRLVVPSVIRLIEDNGPSLMRVPKQTKVQGSERAKSKRRAKR